MLTTILALLLEGFVVLGGIATQQVTLSPSPISLRLSPTTGFAPFSTRATLTIPRSSSNREWCLAWGDEVSEVGRTCKPLDGEASPVTWEFVLKDLEEGEYGVRGELRTSDGFSVTPVLHLTVLGGRG